MPSDAMQCKIHKKSMKKKRLNIHLPYDLIISFLGIFPREMKWYVHITETIQHPSRAFTFHRVLI